MAKSSKTVWSRKVFLSTLPNSKDIDSFVLSHGDSDIIKLTKNADLIAAKAWEAKRVDTAINLARKALITSPLSIDAYAVFAFHSQILLEKIELLERAMYAGEILLKEHFSYQIGLFGDIIETKPYLIARAELADLYWQIGQYDKAINHYQALLQLTPSDYRNIRYILVRCLLQLNRIADLKILLNGEPYKGDSDLNFVYTRALISYKENSKDANELANIAFNNNCFVPEMLAGRLPIEVSKNDYICGEKDEASEYVVANLEFWINTKGSIDWLVQQIKRK